MKISFLYKTTFLLILSGVLKTEGQLLFSQKSIAVSTPLSVDSVTKIIIRYNVGGSSWGHVGVYAKAEGIEIVPLANGDFNLSRFYQVKRIAGRNGKHYHNDTTEINIKRYSCIKKEAIGNWLMQLNTQKENFTESFFKPRLIQPTKKDVEKVATGIKDEDFFDRDNKEEKDTLINRAKRFYMLDSFISLERPNIEGELFVTDAWNIMTIKIINATDTANYDCQFFNNPGQPFHKRIGNNRYDNIPFINLEANTAAMAFLPKESAIYKALDVNSFKKVYLKWLIENFF